MSLRGAFSATKHRHEPREKRPGLAMTLQIENCYRRRPTIPPTPAATLSWLSGISSCSPRPCTLRTSQPRFSRKGSIHCEYHREYSWRGSTASTRGRRGRELGAHAGLFIERSHPAQCVVAYACCAFLIRLACLLRSSVLRICLRMR